jgi:hypothetical protein
MTGPNHCSKKQEHFFTDATDDPKRDATSMTGPNHCSKKQEHLTTATDERKDGFNQEVST